MPELYPNITGLMILKAEEIAKKPVGELLMIMHEAKAELQTLSRRVADLSHKINERTAKTAQTKRSWSEQLDAKGDLLPDITNHLQKELDLADAIDERNRLAALEEHSKAVILALENFMR